MPIYEYKCLNCGNDLEAMQKMSDDPLTECPKCGGELRKQWSRTGFQFKGSGWYVTDYAGKGGEAGAQAKSETKSEGASETKSDGGSNNGGATEAAKPAAGESTAKGSTASKSGAGNAFD